MTNNKTSTSDKIKLIPPLTFRLYQSIKFNRPVNKLTDYVSPGGYELKMIDDNGEEKTVQFDFEEYEGGISEEDPCVVECMQKNPDYNSFEELNIITEHMLRNITEVIDWFIYTGEPGECEEPLIPVAVTDVVIEITRDASGRDISVIKIPVNIPIQIFGNA